MVDDYKERLKDYDWKRIAAELLRYCKRLAAFEGKTPEQLIGASRSVEDIISEAIKAVLSGSRKWDPARGDLVPFLKMGVVRSIYSNTKKTKDNQLLECLDDYYSDTFDSGTLSAPKKDDNVSSLSAENKSIQNQEFQRVLTAFTESVAALNKEDVQSVFECICEGITKPAEIEMLTDIPSARISEIKRQLANRLGGIYEQLQ